MYFVFLTIKNPKSAGPFDVGLDTFNVPLFVYLCRVGSEEGARKGKGGDASGGRTLITHRMMGPSLVATLDTAQGRNKQKESPPKCDQKAFPNILVV